VRGQWNFAGGIPQLDYIAEQNRDTVHFLELSEPAPDEDEIVERLKRANGFAATDDDTPCLQASSTGSSESSSPRNPDDGDDSRKPPKDGSHSLVMLAHRREEQEGRKTKHWFLIQNSWIDRPLFEVLTWSAAIQCMPSIFW